MTLDVTRAYPEVLEYYKLLNPREPKPLQKSAQPWIRECLKSVGWEEGDMLPSGLPEYLSAIFSHFKLSPTPVNAKTLFELDEVVQTVSGALTRVKQHHAAQIASKESAVTEEDSANPVLKPLYDSVRQAESEEPAKVVSLSDAEEMLVSQSEEVDSNPTVDIKEELEPVSYSKCPCCGLNLTIPYSPSEVTEDDKRNYLIHVLGGNRFYKSYPIWNGLAVATLKTPSFEEEQAFTLYYNDKIRGLNTENTVAQAITLYQNGRTALTLHSITFRNNLAPTIIAPEVNLEAFEDKVECVSKHVSNWFNKAIPSVELQMELFNALEKFLEDTNTLKQNLSSPDFYGRVMLG